MTARPNVAQQHPFWIPYAMECPSPLVGSGMKILVLYAIKPGTEKWRTWDDGFVAAMGRVSARGHSVSFFNVQDSGGGNGMRAAVLDCDVVIVKSNWDWIVDAAYRRHVSGLRPSVLVISGISQKVSFRKAAEYEVLVYQTDWYRPRLPRQAVCVHAYGINDDVMFAPDEPQEKSIDWLFVGKIDDRRGVVELMRLDGRRVAVGDPEGASPALLGRLERAHVEVRGYVSQPELRVLYWQARQTFIPASLAWGGERQVMESLRCGTPVRLSPENPKLAEVAAQASTWTTRYFADQLERAATLALLGCDH